MINLEMNPSLLIEPFLANSTVEHLSVNLTGVFCQVFLKGHCWPLSHVHLSVDEFPSKSFALASSHLWQVFELQRNGESRM
jgi:hypothetical protein